MTFITAFLATMNCGPTEPLLRALDRVYGESVVETDGANELWANPETGSWSAIETHGPWTCMRASGMGYELAGDML